MLRGLEWTAHYSVKEWSCLCVGGKILSSGHSVPCRSPKAVYSPPSVVVGQSFRSLRHHPL